jgi:hypothetical protein
LQTLCHEHDTHVSASTFFLESAHGFWSVRATTREPSHAQGWHGFCNGPPETKGKTAMTRNQRVVMLLGLLIVSVAAVGCANGNRVSRAEIPVYENDLANARASIAEAEQAGAGEFGNADLALARDKLRTAERAADDGDIVRAQRLAVEADLDADVAIAITRNRKTQELVTEVRAGLETLENELRRSQATDVGVRP